MSNQSIDTCTLNIKNFTNLSELIISTPKKTKKYPNKLQGYSNHKSPINQTISRSIYNYKKCNRINDIHKIINNKNTILYLLKKTNTCSISIKKNSNRPNCSNSN